MIDRCMHGQMKQPRVSSFFVPLYHVVPEEETINIYGENFFQGTSNI